MPSPTFGTHRVNGGRAWLVALLAGAVSLVSCAGVDGFASQNLEPELRAVTIETDGCRFASGRTGSGVAVGEDRVVTVAHLVARAQSVAIRLDAAEEEEAVVTAVDLERDLAVLRVASQTFPDVEVATAETGTRGHIVGGAASGTIEFEVKRPVELTIEEVLGTDRHSRSGYELMAGASDGDSGAGAYDEADRLIGILFATGPDDETSWLTSSEEIVDFLGSVDPTDTYAGCG